MNPIRFLLGLLTPRHKALAAQCTTGSGLAVTVEEMDRRLGASPSFWCDVCGEPAHKCACGEPEDQLDPNSPRIPITSESAIVKRGLAQPDEASENDTRIMYETLTRCQQECTRLLFDNRKLKWSSITAHVRLFRLLFAYPIRTAPTVPPDDEVRLHLRIIADEFCELLEAHGVTSYREQIMAAIATCYLTVDLVAVADALGDADYTVEGMRQCYGIPRQAIADEIQRSNLSKVGGPVVDGKQMKPPGWKPPDIEGVLRRAGWRG